MTGKEILQALRKKVPAKEFLNSVGGSRDSVVADSGDRFERRELKGDDVLRLRDLAADIKGRNVLVVNDELEVVKNVSVLRLDSIDAKDAFVLIVEKAGEAVIQAAEKLNSRAVAAKTFGRIPDTDVELVSL